MQIVCFCHMIVRLVVTSGAPCLKRWTHWRQSTTARATSLIHEIIECKETCHLSPGPLKLVKDGRLFLQDKAPGLGTCESVTCAKGAQREVVCLRSIFISPSDLINHIAETICYSVVGKLLKNIDYFSIMVRSMSKLSFFVSLLYCIASRSYWADPLL